MRERPGYAYICPRCSCIVREDETQSHECPHCGLPLVLAGEARNGQVLAHRDLRLAAYFADQAILSLLFVAALYGAAFLEATSRAGASVFLSALTWVSLASVVYFIIPTALWGQTLGKWFTGVRVVGPDGDVPRWRRSIIRGLVATLADLLSNSCLVGILDPMWLLWDRDRQTLHDKAAGTVVVTARYRRRPIAFIASLLAFLGVQVGIVFAVIRPFIVQAYYVPSGSMHPTLYEHDRLMVNKLSYRYGKLRRGDIIVFQAPANALLANPVANPDPHEKKDFIKRLIALPGDTVQVEDGRLWLQAPGEKALHTVEEPYLKGMPMMYEWGPVTVPPGNAIVLGDNRDNSNDSHHWASPNGPDPFLPIANIRGRAFYRFWPPWRWAEIPREDF